MVGKQESEFGYSPEVESKLNRVMTLISKLPHIKTVNKQIQNGSNTTIENGEITRTREPKTRRFYISTEMMNNTNDVRLTTEILTEFIQEEFQEFKGWKKDLKSYTYSIKSNIYEWKIDCYFYLPHDTELEILSEISGCELEENRVSYRYGYTCKIGE